jgi:hypothetical protein
MEFSRQAQLDAVLASMKEHDQFKPLLSTAARIRSSQGSHLHGLYDEVDKLAKGKSLLPTSDLLVELVNSLITDMKNLVFRDEYLDRLKAFVPAGNNPNYPDVLVALRILQQTLERFASLLETETTRHLDTGTQLATILGALQVARQDEVDFHENNEATDESSEGESANGETSDVNEDSIESEEEAEENDDDGSDDADESDSDGQEYEDGDEDGDPDDEQEYDEYVSKAEVSKALGGESVSAEWFTKEDDYEIFNFTKLDNGGIPHYVPPSEGITFIKVTNG